MKYKTKEQIKELVDDVDGFPLDNIEALAADANAAAIVTAVNSLLSDLKEKGIMTADSE